jgi:beta-1,2-mannobiose phosphorylase / 1,2-beta-oligomannan phosphorylase
MIKVERFIGNPVLSPQHQNNFDGFAAFNCSLVPDYKNHNKYYALYRAMGLPRVISNYSLSLSTIGIAESTDRVNFIKRRIFIAPLHKWEKYGCEDPRVTYLDGTYYIFYTAISDWPPKASGIKVAAVTTKNFKEIRERHPVTPFNAKAMAMFPQKIKGKIVLILTADTDNPPSKIAIAYLNTISDLWDKNYWHKWYKSVGDSTLSLLRSPKDHCELGAVPLRTKDGWLVIYCYIKNYFSSYKIFGIEALLLDLENPQKIIGRTSEPLLIPERDYEVYGKVYNVIFPSGALIINDRLGIYYGASDTTCCLATCGLQELITEMKTNNI